MKRLLLSAALAALCQGAVFAQANKAATSTTRKDATGQSVTTYKDRFGNIVGTSTTRKDALGRDVTTYKDRFGNTTGTSSASKNFTGGTVTTYKDRFGNIGGSRKPAVDKASKR